MNNQKYTENNLANMMPIFHLKPMSSTRTKCILTMYVNNTEKISDEQLKIETSDEIKEKIGDDTLLLGIVNNYVIIGKYCACNIPGSFLLNNNKIPIYYLSIIYNRQFVTGCLFNFFLYFTIDDDTKKRLNEPKKYYKALLYGKFSIQCVPIDSTKDEFIDKIKNYVEQEIMIKYQDDFGKSDDSDHQNAIMNLVINNINLEMAEIQNFFESQEYDEENDKFPSQKNIFNKLNDICNKPIFKRLVSYSLIQRENERREEKCPDISYEIPKNIINLKEIKENPDKLNEMIKKKEDS
jgi:hypothetical protein